MFRLWLMIAVSLTQGARIVLTNTEGWEEQNVRTFFKQLNVRHDVILVAPGSPPVDPPDPPLPSKCEDSPCDPVVPGFDATNPRLNYYAGDLLDVVSFGTRALAKKFWKRKKPGLVLIGPGIGNRLGFGAYDEASIAAAQASADGFPAIVFRGTTGQPARWIAPSPLHSQIYAQLALEITDTIVESGKPYLPRDTYLNINFAAVGPHCNRATNFRFILTRINLSQGPGRRTKWCNQLGFPYEADVMRHRNSECLVTISPVSRHRITQQGFRSSQMVGPGRGAEKVIIKRLERLLVCPETLQLPMP